MIKPVVSDSRNNLLSAYKQIRKHTSGGGVVWLSRCELNTFPEINSCVTVRDSSEGNGGVVSSHQWFFTGSSWRVQVHLRCHGTWKSLLHRTKAFNPTTMARAFLWNDTCRQWVRIEVDSRTFDKFVRPLSWKFQESHLIDLEVCYEVLLWQFSQITSKLDRCVNIEICENKVFKYVKIDIQLKVATFIALPNSLKKILQEWCSQAKEGLFSQLAWCYRLFLVFMECCFNTGPLLCMSNN